MASAFTLSPTAFGGQEPGPRRNNAPGFPPRRLSVLVPNADSVVFHSAPASPSSGQLRTPLTGSTLGPNYYHHQQGDFGGVNGDPFFGAEFSHTRPGSPSLLDEHLANKIMKTEKPQTTVIDGLSCPMTPGSPHNVSSPRSERRVTLMRFGACPLPDSVSPEQLQTPAHTVSAVDQADWTPDSTVSNRTCDDSLAPAALTLTPLSPRVTVSVWDNDGSVEDAVAATAAETADNCRFGGILVPGDLISPTPSSGFVLGTPVPQALQQDGLATPRVGLDPESRPVDEVPSINDAAAERKVQDRNREVDDWLAQYPADPFSVPDETSVEAIPTVEDLPGQGHDDGIPLGDQTENRFITGQTYYNEAGGGGGMLSQVDREIIASDAKWEDAPMLPHIITGSCCASQPQTSQAAIEKFADMCRDTDSILSRSATWGTRRRSSPSVLDLDLENSRSGSFLKKLGARGRGNGEKGISRAGSLLKDLRGLVSRPSTNSLRKRSRSRSRELAGDGGSPPAGGEQQSASPSRLSPLSPSPTWRGRKQKPTPSINTALASVAHSMVNISTPLPHSASLCLTPPIPSPRTGRASTFGVRASFGRSRSRSDMPRAQLPPARAESHTSLGDLWRRSTGPLLTPLIKTSHFGVGADDEDDEDEDEDEDMYGDGQAIHPNFIDSIPPTVEGFQQHILALNPGLGERHGYLVERIAQQQVGRYKNLLNARIKHLGLGTGCPNGSQCAIVVGSPSPSVDMMPGGGEEGAAAAAAAVEGFIGPESFPRDIPMPPTQQLPAEFECRLCFQRKRFQKPSDWTKHIHEDVQPFTCTWDRCRDPKVFKRKADWVRHENEGHRHLEWWTCDVDDCRHTCYRRDNFLQHLVREHKFPEPKVKTKAAMKRNGGMDPTWQAVEKCHVETSARPQDEPCRFCGKLLPSWKKLTVHLAKHMEHISLSVLRLAAARSKELTADSVISPVLDPAARPPPMMMMMTAAATAQQPQPPFTPGHNVATFHSPSDQPRSFGYPAVAAEEKPTSASLYDQQSYDVPCGIMPTLQGSPPALYRTSPPGEPESYPQQQQLNVMSTPRGAERLMSYEPMMYPGRTVEGQFSGSDPLPSSFSSPMMKTPGGWDTPQTGGFSDSCRLTSPSFFFQNA
ncbi:hypothetical protein L249_3526 [Ophiocordyceps polyrhachis-furcata BCC 54312]|uniref:C2H2-type domain-containing protein n=1 Tax=Ophiocordyceps polyrhachis-furcata BCC 54312 TaxID=1330021 RepID=A0A367LMJ7_9HYPO|nr:hypothetical protein L249_3526 [Ophiocordyceps polyrhachis-furcata BCC 54312]